MKEKVSIIVPVYNVEQYLRKCINSILSQSYKNIELILVNDGSTDNSGKICDEYAEKDKRINVIHKTNGGLSEARNVGIENSTGSYLSFIDSDDYIDVDMIELLYYACVDNDCDIAVCGKYIEKEDGNYYLKNITKKSRVLSKNDTLKSILLNQLVDVSACDKMYKRDLFKNIKFPKDKYFEDMGTIYKIIDKCNKVYHIRLPKYHYIQRNQSITKSKFDNRYNDMNEHKKDFLKMISKKEYRNIYKYCLAFELQILLTIINEYHRSSDLDKMNFLLIYDNAYKELRIKKNKFLFNIHISVKKKLMIIFILMGKTDFINKIKESR